MENIVDIPVDTVVNISVQLWDIAGIPFLIGIVATWLVQRAKLSPNIPLVESSRPWIVRGFVVLVGTVLQIGFYLVAGKPITWEIVQQIALTYFTASTAYTHLFKAVPANT